MTPTSDATVWSLAPILLLAAFVGCGGDEGPIKVYRAGGTVLVDGQPIEGADVILFSDSPEMRAAKAPPPTGKTNADGEYQLRTFDPGDGAPAGEYVATVFWPGPIPPGADEEMYEPKDRLGDRYSDPATSGLTITVPEGGGELPPFELSAGESL